MNDKQTRPVRTDFPTQGYKNLKVKLKQGFRCNERSFEHADMWDGAFSLINITKGEEKEPIIIVDAKCEWRFVGNHDWKPVDYFEMEKQFTCFPMENTDVGFIFRINDETKSVSWFNRSWIARHQPIRFRVTFEDVFGEKVSQVFEYVFSPFKKEVREKSDSELFLYVDNLDLYERHTMVAKKTYTKIDGYGDVVEVNGTKYSETELRSLVFKAAQTNNFEILLFEKDETPNKGFDLNKKAWALIDQSCNRVYAIKMLLMGVSKDSICAHLGYLELDLYGKVDTTKPNLPAIEEFSGEQMKELELEITPHEHTVLVQDDDFDDKLLEYQSLNTSLTTTLTRPVDHSPAVTGFLGMVDNVNRISNSFDKLNSVAQNLDKIAKCTAQMAELFSHK